MKKKTSMWGILVFLLAFAFTACDNGTTSDDVTATPNNFANTTWSAGSTSIRFTSTTEWNGTFNPELRGTFTGNGNTAALTVTRKNGETATGTGTVTIIGSGANRRLEFTITVEGRETPLTGTVNIVTPPDTGNGGVTTTPSGLTITGIPAVFNNHLAWFLTGRPGSEVFGGNYCFERHGIILPRISGNSVTISLWEVDGVGDEEELIRFSGNETFEFGVLYIYCYTMEHEEDFISTYIGLIAGRVWLPITFTNGNATIAWADGLDPDDLD